MFLHIPERVKVEDFVIKDNIIKGVNQDFNFTHSIGEYLLNTLNSKPQHVAQIEAETGKQTTFAEMKDLSVRCAIWLQKQGIGANDIVVVCSKNNLDVYSPIFGTYYIGGIYSGWNPFLATLKPVQHLMQLFKPKIIFAGEDIADTIQEAAKLENVTTKIIVFGKHASLQSFNDIVKVPSEEEVHAFHPQKIKNPQKDIGTIVLTSGSTGLSKGVMHTYENTLKIAVAFSPFSLRGISMWYSTCDWVTGLSFMILSVLLYGTRIIHAKFDAEETCQVIEKYKVNRILASGTMINYMLKTNALKKYNVTSLELVYSCGSKVSPKILQDLKNTLPDVLALQLYGLSETGRCVLSQTENTKSLDAAGFCAPCCQIKIVDLKTGKTLNPNEPGEICVKTPIIMTGYYKNPTATKEILDDEGWLHTGDKGFYNENGEIHIVERIKEMMKYQNFQIAPSEIEQVLLSNPGIIEAAVVPIPHEIDGDWPMAFVKKVSGFQITEDELVNLTASVTGEIRKLRGGVKFLDELPKTSSGKINRPLLKTMAKSMVVK